MLGDVLAGDYRPGAYKSLPQFAAVDLDAMKASWSATAVQPKCYRGREDSGKCQQGGNTQEITTTVKMTSTEKTTALSSSYQPLGE